jgi:methyl-accepting chemotaxis protein
VAKEVKALANQAAEAAEAISKRIEVIQTDTKDAKVSIDQLARDIREAHLPV